VKIEMTVISLQHKTVPLFLGNQVIFLALFSLFGLRIVECGP
jgi:hypothetical protein